MVKREERRSSESRGGLELLGEHKVLGMAYGLLDMVETCLRALPQPGADNPVDLVIQLRQTIIRVFEKPHTPRR